MIVWGATLGLPVGESAASSGLTDPVPGVLVLVMGFAGVIVWQFGWFANLLVLAV